MSEWLNVFATKAEIDSTAQSAVRWQRMLLPGRVDASQPRPASRRSSATPRSALLVVVLALGCNDGTGWPIRAAGSRDTGADRDSGAAGAGSTSAGGSGGTSAGSTGTVGCNGNAAPPTSPPNGYLTIDVNGTSREYALELSAGYDGTTPQPVLIALHGNTVTAQDFLGSGYGNVRNGVAGRAILVGLEGLSRNGQTGWMTSISATIEQADYDFFDAVIAQLEANYCVDPGRIFAIGHGAGAYFTNQLGCLRSGVLRGVGPFAGGGPDGGCSGKAAAFIGWNPSETVVPWSTFGWFTTKFWTQQNGCGDPGAMPTAPYPGDGTTGSPAPCQPFVGCDPSYPVTLCLYDYSDPLDGNDAFPLQWGGRAATDFFLALPRVP
jgi:polyhydroxybutyrate depolymerase